MDELNPVDIPVGLALCQKAVSHGAVLWEDMTMQFKDIYRDTNVLVTGHTGFKGAWLSLWLGELGAAVSGCSLPPAAGDNFFSLLPPSLFRHSIYADIRDAAAMKAAIAQCQPDIIFHLAAQPIVGASYRDPIHTLTTNTLGTATLLEVLRETGSGAAVVVVTSDKCYRNHGEGRPFREEDAMGGHDVYSMSKAAAELVVASWHASFFSQDERLGPLATARGGNAIGGGDYGEDRLIPDGIRAFLNRSPLVLRNPAATRPWQHVLELLSGYLALGQRLLTHRDKTRLLSFNFGPSPDAVKTVQHLVEKWQTSWPDSFNLGTKSHPAYPEARSLTLDHSRAIQELGWQPAWHFASAVAHTARWYQARHASSSDDAAMLELSRSQIHTYAQDARAAGAAWAAD